MSIGPMCVCVCAATAQPPSPRAARQIGVRGAAHALARRQQRYRFQQVGLAGAVGADQHLRLGPRLERHMRVVAEVGKREPLDPKHELVCALCSGTPGGQRHGYTRIGIST